MRRTEIPNRPLPEHSGRPALSSCSLRLFMRSVGLVALLALLVDASIVQASSTGVEEDETEEELQAPSVDGEADEGTAPEVAPIRTRSVAPLRESRGAAGPPVQGLNTAERAERGGESWMDLMRESPGLRMRNFGPAPERPVLRGLEGERILVLEDGQRMGDVAGTAADHAISADPLSVVSLEVIRGPASVLYGGSALGGVVNLRRASLLDLWPDGPALTLRTSATSADRGLGGHVRGAWGGDHFAGALRASGRFADDLRTAEGRLADTDSRSAELGADLGWRMNRNTGELRVSWRGHRYGIPEEWDDEDERVEISLQRLRASHEWIHRGMGGRVDQIRHSASATLYDHEEREIEFEDGEVDDIDLELVFDIFTHSQRLEVALRPSEGVLGEMLAGADFDVQSVRIAGEEVLTPDALRTRVGLFALQHLRASDHLEFPIGLRGETVLISTQANERFEEQPSRTFLDVGASAGVLLRALPGVTVGAQASRAFRAPLIEELYSDAPHIGAGAYEIGDPDLSSENATGGDLWAEVQVEGFRGEVSGFISRVDDYIVRDPTGEIDPGSGLPVFVYRAAQANLLGAELVLAQRLPANLRIRARGDWVRGSESGFGGEALPSIPPLQGNLQFGWHPRRTFLRIDTTFTASQRRTSEEEEETEGHVLLGAEVGQRFNAIGGFFTATLRIDNALDVAWRDHLSQVERRGTPSAGRNVRLSIAGEW